MGLLSLLSLPAGRVGAPGLSIRPRSLAQAASGAWVRFKIAVEWPSAGTLAGAPWGWGVVLSASLL